MITISQSSVGQQAPLYGYVKMLVYDYEGFPIYMLRNNALEQAYQNICIMWTERSGVYTNFPLIPSLQRNFGGRSC
jgi:hypothetical protein